MRKILISIVVLYSWVYAVSHKVALESCEVYNDLKHKKNSFKKHLKIGTSYRVMREQSDHYYISIPNITIPNRWVETKCFDAKATNSRKVFRTDDFSKSKKEKDNGVKKPNALLLALSWQNAFCQTNRFKKECRRNLTNRRSDNKFVLHGLWPQPKDNAYCHVKVAEKKYDKNRQWNRIKKLDLTDVTRKSLSSVMPGVASDLHRHEWLKHGTCYGTTAEEYFNDSIKLVNQVNRSRLANFFLAKQGRSVTLQQIRFKVDESFGKGSGKRVEMKCRDGLVTELWFHIGYGGSDLPQLLKDGDEIQSHCKRGKIDRAGF